MTDVSGLSPLLVSQCPALQKRFSPKMLCFKNVLFQSVSKYFSHSLFGFRPQHLPADYIVLPTQEPRRTGAIEGLAMHGLDSSAGKRSCSSSSKRSHSKSLSKHGATMTDWWWWQQQQQHRAYRVATPPPQQHSSSSNSCHSGVVYSSGIHSDR